MQATEFVRSYIDAWNDCDPVAVGNHLSRHLMYLDVPENVRRTKSELVTSLDQFFSSHRHRYELIGEVAEGPNTIAFQYRICPHVYDGNTGTEAVQRGAEFITLDGDAAISVYDYYDLPEQPAEHSTAHGEKYAKSGLSADRLAEYRARLEHAMSVDRLYLRSDLTLPKLAAIVDCSVNHMSQVINSGVGLSFFDYLNRHRVDHAKELLASGRGQGGAVLNVAFAVGFNSNSAFYAAFKKYVGETPAQYRRRAHN